MTHGHEVLHMMEGKAYSSKAELVDAIIRRFGKEERFFTCSANGLTAAQLVDFLESKGKFKPADAHAFTVDKSKVCNNH